MNWKLHFIGWFWLIFGVGFTADSAIGFYRLFDHTDLGRLLQIKLPEFGFCILVLVASVLFLMRHRWGRRLVKTVSVLLLIYGGMYVLFGGLEDRGAFYTLVVFFTTAASLMSLITLRKSRSF